MEQEWGWYLYGIIERRHKDASESEDSLVQGSDDIQLLQQGDITAVVRSVRLADYQPEALRARLHDARWLEVMASHHHDVIESIHHSHPILPATFGCVYPDEDCLRASLADLQETLLARLTWLTDCDEWTVRVYSESASLSQSLVREHPRIQQMQQEIDSATPGRAYLLKRMQLNELTALMDKTAVERADEAFTRMSHASRASIVQAPNTNSDSSQSETEILRAVFLVPRPDLAAFLGEVESTDSRDAGIRSEYSGPWPPYSFAKLDEEWLRA